MARDPQSYYRYIDGKHWLSIEDTIEGYKQNRDEETDPELRALGDMLVKFFEAVLANAQESRPFDLPKPPKVT